MEKGFRETLQDRLDSITRKWWFLLLFLLLFFLPSFSSVSVASSESPRLVATVVSNALIYSYPAIMPVFKILPLLLVFAVILFGKRATRAFDLYAAGTIVLFATLQSMANTEEYGFAIVFGNLVPYMVVALSWMWEAVVRENDFTPGRRPVWKYWVVPVAFLAFWFPVDLETLTPDFALIRVLTSEAGLTGCMMIPVYLATLTLYHPRVNAVTLRITGFAGLVTGVFNEVQWFGLNPDAWWMGVLHLPLLLISPYALLLSFVSPRSSKEGERT